MQVAVIPANPNEPIRIEDIEIGLDTMQELVGGYIEAVGMRGEMTMYLNEEGKLQGLPHNPRATILAHGAEAISPADWIAGTAVLTGPLDDEGYDTSLPDELADGIRLFGSDYAGALEAHRANTAAARAAAAEEGR